MNSPLAIRFTLPRVFAQIPPSLKSQFQYGLGLLFLIGFIVGVLIIWTSADKMRKGEPDAKSGILAGFVMAGAAAIMGAFFFIFGISDGILTPQF